MSSRAVRQFRSLQPCQHLLLSGLVLDRHQERARRAQEVARSRSRSRGAPEQEQDRSRRRKGPGKRVTWSRSLLQVRSISPRRRISSPSWPPAPCSPRVLPAPYSWMPQLSCQDSTEMAEDISCPSPPPSASIQVTLEGGPATPWHTLEGLEGSPGTPWHSLEGLEGSPGTPPGLPTPGPGGSSWGWRTIPIQRSDLTLDLSQVNKSS